MITDNFIRRHNGPGQNEVDIMLQAIGVTSVSELIDQTVPASIRMEGELSLPKGMNEYEYQTHLREIARKNKIFKSYIGLGYYNTITPGVIQRNILENPGWYTSYTPYQAEISQGRLEALLNFQTMVSDLTGLPIANSSLLDEGTAAAEAMIMLYNSRSREKIKQGSNIFLVAENIFPQTKEVLKTRALPLGIQIEIADHQHFKLTKDIFGLILQYPDQWGGIYAYETLVKQAHDVQIDVIVASDLLSLTLLKPPGEWGADVVVGSSQRFGIPIGFGGPHAAYFATIEKYKRSIPGRIIGISLDANGNRALRMALQTREQHIKRERATSNICTAQALLAIMAGFYAAYHGHKGLKAIATDIHQLAVTLSEESSRYGFELINNTFFDTLTLKIPASVTEADLKRIAESHECNFRFIDSNKISVALDETTSLDDVNTILKIFAEASNTSFQIIGMSPLKKETIPAFLKRTTAFLSHPVFNTYHSETAMMRYIKTLENKDLALNRTMIPLGSCTMKLNAAAELFSLSWPEFGEIHPFAPADQVAGYLELISNLENDLSIITGFHSISLQPNSGASGEYTGLLVIREYLQSIGEGNRDICLIPSSAHGTNPASSVMAGMKVVIVTCDEEGNIDLNDLRNKAEAHRTRLAAIMVTYPSTHGVFEENIREVVEIIHQNGGQVYMDGANMNAQVGLTKPGIIGADVCHLNLHKTFAIPHGGGGPGVGPIGVARHLAPFLPGHPLVKTGGLKAITPVSSAPFGSAMILPISYGYIKLLGNRGLRESTEIAILNANYLKSKLEGHYKILYTGKKSRVAHEMILDCNSFAKSAEISVIDIAKRLIDYGFHAPTVAFPVHGTLMVEPTESESLDELDRFIDAMIKIRQEVAEIEQGKADKNNNVLKNAPHTIEMVIDEQWTRPYSREKAGLPAPFVNPSKFWPPVTRIDDAYGDRNLVCTCMPVAEYL